MARRPPPKRRSTGPPPPAAPTGGGVGDAAVPAGSITRATRVSSPGGTGHHESVAAVPSGGTTRNAAGAPARRGAL